MRGRGTDGTPKGDALLTAGTTGTRTILVADDHPALLAAVSALLERHGLVVVQARRGEEALERLQSETVDAAVIDIRMPGLSGLEIAREAARVAPAVPIVLYTGHG